MNTIATFLETGKLARKQSHRNLTLFPLLAADETRPDYLTLEQALEQNLVEISELDQDGSVPELRLINKGKSKILIIESRVVSGAALTEENRVIHLSAFRKVKNPSSRGVRYRRYSERYNRRQRTI